MGTIGEMLLIWALPPCVDYLSCSSEEAVGPNYKQSLCCSATLQASGVENHDLITMTRRGSGGQAGAQSQGQAATGGFNPTHQQLLQQARGNPQLLASLPPHLRQRVERNDVTVVEEIIRSPP